MKELINIDLNQRIPIAVSSSIDKQLMVCSHERSGTHFLMNTIGNTTDYCCDPWLNYDYNPLGGLNFFYEKNVSNFIKSLAKIKSNGREGCNASILKSHFPLSHLGSTAYELPLKIIYIYRDPAEVFHSYWQILHRWDWNEGPKTKTPCELISLPPSGQSQRYQLTNHKDYFERWALHTLDGINSCEANPNACHISYKNLAKNHQKETRRLCKSLDIEIRREVRLPSRTTNVIQGKSLPISADEIKNLEEVCNARLKNIPELLKYFHDPILDN